MNWYEFETCPFDEDCACVGRGDYHKAARLEARVYIAQLIRTYGKPPEGVRLKLANHEHDFGTVYEIKVYFDDAIEEHCEYAENCSEHGCDKWDDISRQELAANNYEQLKIAS